MSDKIDKAMTLHQAQSDKDLRRTAASSRPAILVVTRNGRLSEPVMEYGVNVADRLGCRLLVVFVNTMPMLLDNAEKQKRRNSAIEESVVRIRSKAEPRKIPVDHVQETGRVSRVIHDLCHIVKRVEFVVIDKGINLEKALSRASVPVFNVLSGNMSAGNRGGRSKKSAVESQSFTDAGNAPHGWLKTAALGLLTFGLYGVIIQYSYQIMKYWTEGGVYSFLPAATACVFCCVQMLFIDSLRSTVGARLKKNRQTTKTKRLSPTAKTRRNTQRQVAQ